MSVIAVRLPPTALMSSNLSSKIHYDSQKERQLQRDVTPDSQIRADLSGRTEDNGGLVKPCIQRSLSEPFLSNITPGKDERRSSLTSFTNETKSRNLLSSPLRRNLSGRLSKRPAKGTQGSAKQLESQLRTSRKEDEAKAVDVKEEPSDKTPEHKGSRLSASFSRYSRHSRILLSRPPSSGTLNLSNGATDGLETASHQHEYRAVVSTKSDRVASPGLRNSATDDDDKASAQWQSRPHRYASGLIDMATNDTASSPLPPVPRLPSATRSSSPASSYASSERPPTLPKSMSFERLQNSGLGKQRKRDELWSAFRALDNELYKFQGRSYGQKVSTIRSLLLPFLRDYATHPSNTNLRAEDLDRRINILNNWWTRSLELLNGSSGASYSGSDRPLILEAATAIMVRPEWTAVPYNISLGSDKLSRPFLKSRSTTSLGSTASEFLIDSVLHNVRNLYTQNLLAQTAFVVEKMSIRNVPASLVSFCGKAIAYAFFYCEGVAEILVRLWNIPCAVMQRVLKDHGMQRKTCSVSTLEKVNSTFPVHMHNLAFRSLACMTRYLRTRPQLPIATGFIRWHGPWIGRWCGKDTDLFSCFVKSYFELLCQHIPSDSSLEDRICAPGYLVVLAQLLVRLDTTILKTQNATRSNPNEIIAIPVDHTVEEANEPATVIPMEVNNAYQPMAENRMVRLIRDSLLGSSNLPRKGQSYFADSMERLLRAVSQVVAPSDHASCFALCDFLEESLVILDRFEHNIDHRAIIDWPFWLTVCRAMTRSHNIMAEIRLCAFLYGIWNLLVKDQARRKALCLEWLLREDIFESLFNHWCPMVRAYFMRLLVWRLGRLQGSSTSLNGEILRTLQDRLRQTWCRYLCQVEWSKTNMGPPPSTVPCSPAPGRALLIVKDNAQPNTGDLLLSFDSILSTVSTVSPTASQQTDLVQELPLAQKPDTMVSRKVDTIASPGANRKWGMLKGLMPFASNTASRFRRRSPGRPATSTAITAASSPDLTSRQSPSSEGTFDHAPENQEPTTSPSILPHFRSFSFKYTLEWCRYGSSPIGHQELLPPRMPSTSLPFIPSVPCNIDSPSLSPPYTSPEHSKYTGRALAEWNQLINECNFFFARRRREGVPADEKVETPVLGIDALSRG